MEKREGTIGWVSTCYGVDLSEQGAGGRCVVVRAERSRGEVKCSPLAPDDPAFRSDIADNRPVAGCLSVRESFSRWLSTPLASPAKARSVLPTLLDIQLPFALEDCVCEFLCLGRDGAETRALAVAARHADIRKRLDAFAACGLDPLALDHEGLAAWTQSLRECPPPREQGFLPRAVLILNPDRCTLVLGRGERYDNAHSLPQADPAVISRLLRAAWGTAQANSAGPVRWFFAGSGARDTERVASLHSILSASWPGPATVHQEPETFLARAVATRALLPGPLRCNLRSGPMAHPDQLRRSRRRVTRTAVAALLAGAFLIGVNWATQEWMIRAEARVDTTFSTLRDRLMGYRIEAKGRRALDSVRLKIQKDKEDLRPFVNALEPSLADRASTIAEIARTSKLTLDTLSISLDRIAIEGTAQQWDGCDDLVKRLRAAGYPIRLERQEALPDGRIPFLIQSGGDDA